MHLVAPSLLALLAAPPEPGAAAAWLQPALMLLCVAAAAAWLTARWLIRRRSGCAGDCSRCTAHGADTVPGASEPGACRRPPPSGVRPEGLRVLQGPGSSSSLRGSSALRGSSSPLRGSSPLGGPANLPPSSSV